MAQTVTECLSAGADSVALINGVNTDGASSVYTVGLANQTEINELVQRNVDHLETILAYTSTEDTLILQELLQILKLHTLQQFQRAKHILQLIN